MNSLNNVKTKEISFVLVVDSPYTLNHARTDINNLIGLETLEFPLEVSFSIKSKKGLVDEK